MMKLLLVTFAIDLGSNTFEKRFIHLFQNRHELDLKIFRFAPTIDHPHPRSIFTIDYAFLLFYRLRQLPKLYQAIQQAHQEERKVLFYGVSPALFGYVATGNNRSYVVTDWTRKLYEQIWKSSASPGWLTQIHQKILNSQKAVLGLTDAVVKQIAKDYNVPDSKLKKAKLPLGLDLKLFTHISEREDQEVRILFVGGDFHRKGGDLLLNWFKENYQPGLKMTMVTSFPVEEYPEITVERNVQYGETKHIEIYTSHDIFVLPTHYDAYPSVLGEAACAGLAILTTKNALGASEVIRNGENGYICDSPEALLKKLKLLIKDQDLLATMKRNSRKIMEKEFADEVVYKEYIKYIFEYGK
jgi:glycosyltransferase involved in cell wall biosynthesis